MEDTEKQETPRSTLGSSFKDLGSALKSIGKKKSVGAKKDVDEKPEDQEDVDDLPPWLRESSVKPKKKCCTPEKCSVFRRWTTVAFIVLGFMTLTAVLIWHFVLIALVKRLQPPTTPSNGIQTILNRLTGKANVIPDDPMWLPDFTRDVNTVQCHSHNDYNRNVPLYDAIAAGCTGVEADIQVYNDSLFIDHNKLLDRSGHTRTLQSIYLDPLMAILKGQNDNATAVNGTNATNPMSIKGTPWVGVFDSKPDQTLTLLVDFKSNENATWPTLVKQLQPLRDEGWLTSYNTTSGNMTWGPITVVGTGDAPFDMINTPNPTNISGYDIRDIFYDAPLLEVGGNNSLYNSTNSYYASSSLSAAIGTTLPTGFTSSQEDKIKTQLQAAKDANLLGRYWSTPAWPVGWRVHTWKVFVDNEIGMLNVDDLTTATRWNWDWCTVMGLTLC